MSSREYIRFNDSSRATRNRAEHVAQHGGEFVKGQGKKSWVFQGEIKKTTPEKKATKKKLF
jgi:hypothetical protein